MFRSVVFLLVAGAVSCAEDECPHRLDPAFDLKIDRGSTGAHDRVVMQWGYKEDRDISLRDVAFEVQLKAGGKATRKFRLRYNSGDRFKHLLTDLLPETNYAVELTATSPGWETSEPVHEHFSTLPSEWPKPRIVNVTSTIRANYNEFALFWDMKKLPGLQPTFEVRLCDMHCSTYFRDSTANHARVPARFGSDVNISVVAVFNGPDFGPVEVESKGYYGRSGAGKPGRILEVHGDINRERTRVELDWQPPFHPMGPLSYYEVYACEVIKGGATFSNINVTEDPNRYNKFARPLYGHIFAMKMEDETQFDLANPPVNFTTPIGPNEGPPPSPLLLVVGKKAPGCARFKIVFLKPDRNTFSEHPGVWVTKKVVLNSMIGEHFNLAPYTTIHLRVRSCMMRSTELYLDDPCGDFAEFFMRSNVAAPGPVAKALMLYDGVVTKIAWEPPEEPRGPIDGYRVMVQQFIFDYVETETFNRGPNSRAVYFTGFQAYKRHEIKVAAYNWDLEDRTIQHVGEWYNVSIPSRPNRSRPFRRRNPLIASPDAQPESGIPLWLRVFAVFFISLGIVVCFIAFCLE